MTHALLVLDAYDDAGRDSLVKVGATLAGELYRRLVARLCPEASIDVVEFSPSSGFELPRAAAITDYAGIVWTGSSMTVHHDTPAVRHQLEFARAGLAAGVPQFGSCWAAQVAVTATGGRCEPNPRGREFGVARKICLNPAGLEHPMYRGKPAVFDSPTSHEDHIVELGAGVTVLASNGFSPVQAVVVDSPAHTNGRFWAVQYHPEFGLADVVALALAREAQLIQQGFLASPDDAARWRSELLELDARPDRVDLRFRLGIDDDILDPAVRTVEVGNWLASLERR